MNRTLIDRQTGSRHQRTPLGDRACHHEELPRPCPCPTRSAATRACEAKPCSWTSSSCGSGRVQACSCTPSNRMDSQCESFVVRVAQQRPSTPIATVETYCSHDLVDSFAVLPPVVVRLRRDDMPQRKMSGIATTVQYRPSPLRPPTFPVPMPLHSIAHPVARFVSVTALMYPGAIQNGRNCARHGSARQSTQSVAMRCIQAFYSRRIFGRVSPERQELIQ